MEWFEVAGVYKRKIRDLRMAAPTRGDRDLLVRPSASTG